MSSLEIVTRWFDIRSGELRKVVFAFLGAYSVLAFLVLSKALRNALYVTTFDVTTLPYMTIVVAALTLPTVGLFGRAMGSGSPHRVYSGFVAILAATMVAVYALSGISPRAAVLSFYLLTVLGTSLLTSGFWMIAAEQFSLRQAKRLFGVIGAGGTLGAMVTGLVVGPLTQRFSAYELIPGLVLLLVASLLFQRCMPKMAAHHHHEETKPGTPLREGFELIAQSAHLRTIAGVVFLAAMISSVLDYQFIEVVSSTYQNSDEMAGFFAAFYGWTGVISLFLQVFVVARLMSGAGIAASLSILPVLLCVGSAAMLLVPSSLYFWTTTGTRGVDNSLRKSLHRSVLEYLYVPVTPEVRRKTKTFIDSVVDSTASGVGAAVLFIWVTWAGLPARYLSMLIVGLALAFVYMAVRAGRVYKETVHSRLTRGNQGLDTSGFDGRQLLTMTLSNVDIQAELAKAGIETAAGDSNDKPRSNQDPGTTLDRLQSTDVEVVRRALDEWDDWDETHVAALTRLLARTDMYATAVEALLQVGPAAVEYLIDTMLDEHADFVIRRRIPRVLSEVDSVAADQALLDALAVGRFEVRYRAAIALSRRRGAGPTVGAR